MISGWERIKQVENITQTHLWKYTSHIQTAEYHRDCGVAWAHFTCTNSLATHAEHFSKKYIFFSSSRDSTNLESFNSPLDQFINDQSHCPTNKNKNVCTAVLKPAANQLCYLSLQNLMEHLFPLRRVMISPQLQPLAYGSPQCVQSAPSKTSIMGCPGRQEPLGVRGLANSRLHSDSEEVSPDESWCSS